MHKEKIAEIFYNREYSQARYAMASAEDHIGCRELKEFIDTHQLHDKRCLEIGCGRGVFQDFVKDYTGIDLSDAAGSCLHKPFVQTSATQLPFKDNEFDAIWTIAVLEHIHQPQKALLEMRRVLKPGGLLFLHAAWQCRSWAAGGYAVRPFADLTLKGKLIKCSIPIRNSVLFRSLYVFPRRLAGTLRYACAAAPTEFKYKELRPNYDHFWEPDSDAVNSMDPYEAILWFLSRGDECLSHRSWLARFLVRTGAIVFQIRKRGDE